MTFKHPCALCGDVIELSFFNWLKALNVGRTCQQCKDLQTIMGVLPGTAGTYVRDRARWRVFRESVKEGLLGQYCENILRHYGAKSGANRKEGAEK